MGTASDRTQAFGGCKGEKIVSKVLISKYVCVWTVGGAGGCYGELGVTVPQPVWVNWFRMLTFFPWGLTTFFFFSACFSAQIVRLPQLRGSLLVNIENAKAFYYKCNFGAYG